MRPLVRLLLLLAVAVAVVVGGCGSSSSSSGGSGTDPASLMPATTPLYLEMTVRPTGDLKDQMDALASKILRTDDPGAKITSLIDKAIQEQTPGESYAKDIEPWLGEKAGMGLSDFQAEDA